MKQLIINLRHHPTRSYDGMEEFLGAGELFEGMSKKYDVKECRGTLCFSASSCSVTPAELIRKSHVTVVEKKESHSESKYT